MSDKPKLVFRADQDSVKVVAGVRRIDLGVEPMGKPEMQENGWLRCEAVLTRTGVFKYRNADGTERRELRLPQHVFDADSMKSFHLVPVTDDHPDCGWLDAQNTKSYSCGTADMPVKDGDKMRAKLLLTDQGLIAKVMNREKVQVSNGYFADLEMRSGEYEGEAFDAVQTNIRGNHVAIVDEARAGPEARIKMDANDAAMVQIEQGAKPEPSGAFPVLKYKIDGVDYEVSDQAAQALDRKFKKLDEKIAERDAKVEELTAENGKLAGRADATAADLKKHQDALKAATDPKRLAAYVNARVDLVAKARASLGDDFKADGLTDREVRAAVVAKLSPDMKLDGRSDDYVAAAFDALSLAKPATQTARGEIVVDDSGAGDEFNADAIVAKAREFSQNLWKQPLPATAKRNASK